MLESGLFIVAFCAGFVASIAFSILTYIRIFKHLDKFASLMEVLKADNVKTRFIAANAKDSVAMVNTTIEDLQSQIDILRNSQTPTKTEE